MMKIQLLAVLLVSSPLWALEALEDEQLAGIDGTGLGIAVEDFVYDASSATVSVTGVSGTNKIEVDNLYILGPNSRKGSVEQSISLGTLENPIEIDTEIVTAGSSTSPYALKFSLPTTEAGGRVRPLPDIGFRLTADVQRANGSFGRRDVFDVTATGVNMDDTYVRLWNNSGPTVGDARLAYRAKTLDVLTCNPSSSRCNTAAKQLDFSLNVTDLTVDLYLGSGELLPFDVSIFRTGQFALFMPAVSAASAGAFYQTPKSNITAGNIRHGGVRDPFTGGISGGFDMGELKLQGIRIQYLYAESYDI